MRQTRVCERILCSCKTTVLQCSFYWFQAVENENKLLVCFPIKFQTWSTLLQVVFCRETLARLALEFPGQYTEQNTEHPAAGQPSQQEFCIANQCHFGKPLLWFCTWAVKTAAEAVDWFRSSGTFGWCKAFCEPLLRDGITEGMDNVIQLRGSA